MTYHIEKTNRNAFMVFMDYDHAKCVQLSDALDADPKLEFGQYTGNKNANINTIFLHITDDELCRAGLQAQKEYIDAICRPILSES